MRGVHGLAAGCLVLIPALAVHDAPDPLRFTVQAPTAVRLGEPVPITLRLTNPTDRSVDAYFLGRTITFDIVVTKADDTVAWRRLGKSVVPSILQVRTMGPGDVLEWKDVWQPVERGRYRIQGVLPSDARDPRRTPEVGLVVS